MNSPATSISICPVHCSRQLSRCGVSSCSVRSHVELVVRLIGLKVFSRSSTASCVRQSMVSWTGPATPSISGDCTVFHCPACKPSAQAARASKNNSSVAPAPARLQQEVVCRSTSFPKQKLILRMCCPLLLQGKRECGRRSSTAICDERTHAPQHWGAIRSPRPRARAGWVEY